MVELAKPEDEDFNPRSLAGATRLKIWNSLRLKFQSTLPCGSDMRSPAYSTFSTLFQSTLPCGSDQGQKHLLQPFTISIHAPLRERLGMGRTTLYSKLFQSTLPCGSDLVLMNDFKAIQKFQSTLPCGSDPDCRPIRTEAENFNPRSLAGATYASLSAASAAEFQSTLPCGSDLGG